VVAVAEAAAATAWAAVDAAVAEAVDQGAAAVAEGKV
jgi:hypothetical protein